ncbi:MAG: LPS-assembly protein LptD [Bacteroidaceae bacterium]|nr:LPS-assembly protein LptD [Bacteroidaceae bacterium]
MRNEFADSVIHSFADSVRIALSDSAEQLITDSLRIALGDSISEMDSLRYVVIDGDTVILNRGGMRAEKDTVNVDTAGQSRNALDAPVEYTASDSITFDYETNRANLFGEAKVNYTNLELEADLITMSMDSSLVHAVSRRDSLGNIITPPVFKQGSDEYEPDDIAYNFKTRRAFINNVYTQQGEGYLISGESKRDSTGTMFFKDGKYTTCDAKHPHFYLALTKGKMRPGKDVVFGPAYLVVEDVPLPLALPYGFFPFTDDFSSGLIMPTYGDETVRGFYLRDGGYYFAISDKVDLKVLGEIYTKGSWGLSAMSNYRKRYRFSGSINFSYQNTKEGEKNMPDYSVSKSFKFQWSHRQDAKANPSQSFQASVNFATSSYEQNNLNSMYNPQSRTQSTRTSSISYSKTFSDIGLTISTSMNLSQNMRDSSISMTLPSLNITLARFNPFRRKKQVGKERWYEKIAMSYTGTLNNSISTKESLLLHSNLIRDWRNGMKHDIPINASFSLFNYINITPSFNFTDRMYSHKINRSWNTESQQEVRDTTYGFYNVYNYNVSMSASTKLYGMYTPIWGKKIVAIRHVFTPTINFSYAPDFGAERYGFWGTYVKTDADGNVSTVEYSPYQGMLYGVPSKGMTGNISVDISNNLEMKVRADRDSTKKISLIDELGASMSYNMAAKVKPWSNLSTRLRLKLSKSYTFSLNAVFATYAYEFDRNGNIIEGNHTEYSQGRFGRFQGMSQNFSYTFNNQTFKNWFGGNKKDKNREDEDEDEEEDTNIDSNMDPELSRGQRGAEPQNGDLDEDGYLKFKLPWSFSISYGVNISEDRQKEKFNAKRMRYPYHLTHTLNFSGNIRIASGWDLRWSSGYDFNYKKLSMTTATVSRDLHCFNMSCSVVLAPYTSFNFTFQANSSALADALKWKKHSNRSQGIDWY